MIQRTKLIDYLHTLLSVATHQDYAPNGLQVEGKETVYKICTAVTASLDAIQSAIEMQADALFVHHGFFWRGEDPTVVCMRKQRLAHLLKADMNLFAYHLPLDCHETLGNNVTLGEQIGLHRITGHLANKTPNLLWSGQLKQPLTVAEFAAHLSQVLKRPPLVIAGSKPKIQHVAWCSGAAQDFIEEAKHLNVDAYISGEVSERTYYEAKELDIHYFACGHHATERYGIQALGEHLATKFNLVHQFIDSDNPV